MCVKQIDTVQESDNLLVHKMTLRKVIPERFMDNQDFDRLTTEEKGMIIVSEFPKNPQNTDSIVREVRIILHTILWEYLDKAS